jgi:DNA-directed RNA polymerase subunit RPC12/RpoP
MNKKLKTLDEHNSEQWKYQVSMIDNSPRLNGIACPNCEEEMYDTNPNETLTSFPAQKNIHCENCKYKGYRVA